MSLSALYGTGQGNYNEYPSHPKHPGMIALKRLPTTSVPSVSRPSNGIQHLIVNNEDPSLLAAPIVVVQKPDESPSKTLTNSEVQNIQVESDNNLDRRTKALPQRLATLPKPSLPKHEQDRLYTRQHNNNNGPGGDNNDEIDEVDEPYYSCADSFHDSDHDDGAPKESGGIDDERSDKNNPYAKKGHLQPIGNFAIEPVTDVEFSEDDETEGMKLLAQTPILIKDRKGEIHPINACIDTGARSSFISKDTVKEYGLKERPIKEDGIIDFSNPISSENCRPETYVDLPVKSKKIGIDEFIVAKIRVLDGTGFDIIFGRPFIGRHHLLANLPKFDRAGNPFFTLIGGRSEGIRIAMSDEDWNTNGATAAQKSWDRAIKEQHRETALALDRLKDAGSSSKTPPTRSSTVSDSTKSTASWDDASVDWDCKESSNTSWATKTGTKNSGDNESFGKVLNSER